MPKAFLPAHIVDKSLHSEEISGFPPTSNRDTVRVMVIGSINGTERVIHELFRLGFAEVGDWSKPIPANRPNEVIRILTRYILNS